MRNMTLNNALCSPDGLVDVTKVKIEILPRLSFRWTAWDGKRRLVSAPFQFAELLTHLHMAVQSPELFLKTGVR